MNVYLLKQASFDECDVFREDIVAYEDETIAELVRDGLNEKLKKAGANLKYEWFEVEVVLVENLHETKLEKEIESIYKMHVY